MTPLAAQAFKEAIQFSLFMMSPLILYVAFCLTRGIIDDIKKLIRRLRHAER